MAIESNTAIIKTTIIISIRVNPLFCFNIAITIHNYAVNFLPHSRPREFFHTIWLDLMSGHLWELKTGIDADDKLSSTIIPITFKVMGESAILGLTDY
jgi:hypothetical protein